MSIGKRSSNYSNQFVAMKDKEVKSHSPDTGLKPELAELHDAVLKACQTLSIKFPLTRQDFMDICKALNLHCTYRQAVEAVLVSRGR